MDKIQEILINAGHKDLAQEYFKKITGRAGKQFKKIASYGEATIGMSDSPDSPMVKIREHESNPNLNKKFGFKNGLASVSEAYNDLLIPMAQYVFTAHIVENPPLFATDSSLENKIALVDVATDIGKSMPCMNDVCAVYKDKIVTAKFEPYKGYIVACRTSSREAAREWMDSFEHDMRTKNQFIGKCLYASNQSLIFKDIPKVSWDDVVLSDSIKKDIRMNTLSFFNNKRLREAGVNKRGIMLFGFPGTGKTTVVKAIYNELNNTGVSRIYVTAESFRYMPIQNFFGMLEYLGPIVMAFEDIDMVSGDRETGNSRHLGDLLTNLDGMRKFSHPLVVMATTNKIAMMDEALANRPCRFDRKIEIGLPDDHHLQRLYTRLVGAEVNDGVIKLSAGFTGSHVVESVNTAHLLSVNEGKTVSACLEDACQIIRDNFFPGQDNSLKIKACIQSRFIKKAVRIN